jgi:hypothetical protein
LDDKGTERVWCSQQFSGLEKRQCTILLTLCADNQARQPKPNIVFRGTGNKSWNPKSFTNGLVNFRMTSKMYFCFGYRIKVWTFYFKKTLGLTPQQLWK